MTEEEVLEQVLTDLTKLDIPYALTGGLAVSYYGKPRSTHDFDLIIQVIGQSSVKKIIGAFQKDFYVSEEGITDALIHKTMFNIIHHETGLKIDLWILKEDDYARGAFVRRKRFEFLGISVFILSAEDMIINKLLWYKASDVDKHLNDARSIAEMQKDNLDLPYLKKWALKLSVADLLGEMLS